MTLSYLQIISFPIFADPTSYLKVIDKGRRRMTIFSRIKGNYENNVYLFNARFSDHSGVEFRVDNTIGQSKGRMYASRFAKVLGRIPLVFRTEVSYLDLTPGLII